MNAIISALVTGVGLTLLVVGIYRQERLRQIQTQALDLMVGRGIHKDFALRHIWRPDVVAVTRHLLRSGEQPATIAASCARAGTEAFQIELEGGESCIEQELVG